MSTEKLGPNLSPLASPKPKHSPVSSSNIKPGMRKNLSGSASNISLTKGLSTDSDDVRSSSIAESRFNGNSRKLLNFNVGLNFS